jgi:hypothetical protein
MTQESNKADSDSKAGEQSSGNVLSKVLTDTITLTCFPPVIKLYQRGSLIATTRMLGNLAQSSASDGERSYFAIAATICAQAAAEAILNEWAEQNNPPLYLKYKDQGLVVRARQYLQATNGTEPPDLVSLSEAKNALSHAEPDNARSVKIGNWVAGNGAARSVTVVDSLEAHFFPVAPPV